jgi:Thermolysin metallopeptidase, alpha-helical domain/Fibronectin type III domain
VAHELSHGVTQHTSGLVYWYQSGAINESMSDVFGELVDLSDGIGNDDPSVRWQLGEDLPSIPGEDLTRNLRDPLAHGQPDRVNGSFWTSSGSDSGGVHTNSGVGNKAAYLITDGTAGEPGGTFNGQTIPVGLGVEKASQIYWRTEQLLTPGADYSDLANALVAACSSLAAGGIAGITASDCSDVVAKATVATQMQAFSGPTAPRSLKILGGYKQIHLTWTRPAAAGSAPITSYVLIVKPAIQGENFLPIDDPKAHDVRIGGIPAGRTFTFSLVAVTPFGNSPAASLILQGTKLSMSVKRSVAFGSRAKIKGRLTLTNGSGVRGRHVTLYRKVAGKSGYHKVKTKTTSRTGRYTFKQRQTAKTSYYVQFASKVPGLMGARSTKRPVKVRRWVSLRANDQTVRVGTAVSFTGRVDPASGAVTLQRRPATGQQASTWSRVARDRLDGSGRYRLGWTARSGRDFAWRVVAPAHHGLDRGVSRTRVVRVT